ncbi:hypothetical protein K491DRAFT_605161 [Lophiostoma macrostomum CBS 122681]|uniref:Glutamyl-tRNA(Gln) amidotransferase subunit B, mitochondrial n=1 Tax=Lophiostoma macrostomum CBS 122681 TaxID=1314788 RepID=A0A6A6SXK4_9PLEO|nr:hypothetical protein K491DRAFT_605161 [Lophiostoma macrostomum CBS 122681]
MLAHPVRKVLGALPKRPYICPSCLRRARDASLASSRPPTRILGRNLQTDTAAPPNNDAPFRKALKDAAKQRRKEERDATASLNRKDDNNDPRLEKWELTVGIEIHAELNTARKLFSRAATSSSAPANSHVSLFDVAFPGSQPHFQRETLVPALRAALALNCDIQPRSSFDRKHYFYQDQPAGYQLTQYYEPFAKDGHITLYPHDFPAAAVPDDVPITIGIKQVQMEQDTAKTVQQPPHTNLLDFNRVSHPLVEIITLPQIHDPTVAAVCVRKIQGILRSVNACITGMEMGGLRADVNVSVRERATVPAGEGHSYHGVTGLGQRTEIKNLASVKAVEDAIVAERDRQIDLLESGGAVEGETRGWTLGSKSTKRLRGKEGEIDYRYMPDPDIAPVFIGKDLVEHLRATLPTLSDDSMTKLTEAQDYGLTVKDASTLLVLDDGDRLDHYLDVVEHLRVDFAQDPEALARIGKVAGNWVLMELGGLFKDTPWFSDRVTSGCLASIISLVLHKRITGRTAKTLLALKFDGDTRTVGRIIDDEDLSLRPLTLDQYKALAQQLIDEKPDLVKDIVEKGQRKKVKWFVGQMMARGSEGSVEPEMAERVLEELLGLWGSEEE